MYHCGHSVQMTLMRYTDLSARPRHNNNHVLTQTPIITKPIRTICETELIHRAVFLCAIWVTTLVILDLKTLHNYGRLPFRMEPINWLICFDPSSDILSRCGANVVHHQGRRFESLQISPLIDLKLEFIRMTQACRLAGWGTFSLRLVNNKNVSSLSTIN